MRHPNSIIAAASAASLLVLFALGTAKLYFHFMSGFFFWDDEGYIMLSAKSFLEGSPLYTDTFTQYGPAFYLWRWLLNDLFTVPITHDATRLTSLIIAQLTAVLICLTVRRATNRWWPVLLSYPFAVAQLRSFQIAPGHPQELIVLLIAALLLLASHGMEKNNFSRSLTLGIVLGLLFGIKINVGLFMAFGTFLWLLMISPPHPLRKVFSGILGVIVLALPSLLTRQLIANDWVIAFSLVVTCAVFPAVLISIKGCQQAEISFFKTASLIAGGLLTSVIGAALIVILRGTDIFDLLNGTLLRPLEFPGQFIVPIPANGLDIAVASAGVLGFLSYYLAKRFQPNLLSTITTDTLSIVGKALYAGIVFGATAIGQGEIIWSFAISWMWLTILPTNNHDKNQQTFALLLLCCLPLVFLQCYPVAGSQLKLSLLFFGLPASLALSDTANALSQLPGLQLDRHRFLLGLETRRITIGLLFLGVLGFLSMNIAEHSAAFSNSEPLSLPGASWVRVKQKKAEQLRTVTELLTRQPTSFYSYPGLNSFYFWTGKTSPTNWNSAAWNLLFDETMQGQIISELDRQQISIIVWRPSRDMKQALRLRSRPPPSLLSDWISEQFEFWQKVGRYRLLRRKSPVEPASKTS